MGGIWNRIRRDIPSIGIRSSGARWRSLPWRRLMGSLLTVRFRIRCGIHCSIGRCRIRRILLAVWSRIFILVRIMIRTLIRVARSTTHRTVHGRRWRRRRIRISSSIVLIIERVACRNVLSSYVWRRLIVLRIARIIRITVHAPRRWTRRRERILTIRRPSR